MEVSSLAEVLRCLALAVALAACAGLRAWLPLLLAAGLARAGMFELGPQFQFLASNRALVILGVATVVEVLGDKVPALDHALDVLGTFLRPAAGALLAASVFGRISDPLTAGVLGVAIGAPAALVPHVAKAGLRAVSTAFTAGIANPVVSAVEDALSFLLFALAVLVPALVAALTLLLAILVLKRALARSRRPVPAR